MASHSLTRGEELTGPHPTETFADGAAHIWLGTSVDEVAPEELALLSAAERNRVRLLHGKSAAASYAAAHVGTRRILAGYLDTDPAELRLGRTLCPECADPAHGPPSVVWPPTGLTFNLSRSDGHWLLAVTAGRQIGVDLEAKPRVDPELTAPLAFTERELAHLRAQTDPAAQRAVFLRCWTRKEAVVKAVGVGLAADLCRIEVHPQLPGPVLVDYGVAPGPGRWILEEPDIGPELYGALAREQGSTGEVLTHEYGVDRLPGA
ncbi:hypothetical protein CFP65_3399 [Kitasatospora sp. MMS16-BH015]|uniref:4'-phosphopantetheinyl transferase family protein n=1 Tax=Kitasatospora sp. MMS16-BH015 TaxID=2018025 RepID=UPI000CA28CE8|nr:4'-phosphopantetheinyl transferase superfamily protein [Kitasatospora sp. MMS16-BH015]AUG78195.1 hypothetical protein CFP65_3399 [Kitasatospora sp. MMS16-BH015]